MKKLKSKVFFILMGSCSMASTATFAQHREEPRAAVTVTARVHHPVVQRKAEVHYNTLPRFGASVTVVPPGAGVIRHTGGPYYNHNGVYYAHHSGGYAIVRPRRGLRISILPVGYRPIMVGPRHYFYYYGSYYEQINNNYTVVDPPVGAVVESLPSGYTVENINGVEYYMLDGVTYAEVDAPEYPDGIGYEVVRL